MSPSWSRSTAISAGSTFHPCGVSNFNFAWTAFCTLLRTLTPICDLTAPPTGATTTGEGSSTEIGGPTASGRSDCPSVGSMNLTLAMADASSMPRGCSVSTENLASTIRGYGEKGVVSGLGSEIAYTVSVSGLLWLQYGFV